MSRFWRFFIGDGKPRQGTQLEQELWEVCETFLTVGPGDEEERGDALVATLGKLLQEYQAKAAHEKPLAARRRARGPGW